MPRKPKVTAVPIRQPEGLVVALSSDEAQTDAERMTALANEIKANQNQWRGAKEDEPKPNAKRAPRRKNEGAKPFISILSKSEFSIENKFAIFSLEKSVHLCTYQVELEEIMIVFNSRDRNLKANLHFNCKIPKINKTEASDSRILHNHELRPGFDPGTYDSAA